MDHMSGTDRRLSYSQHDKYMYVSCHTYLYLSCWLEDNLLSVPETCDPWMAWYIPVLIMLTRRQSSVGSWHVPFMDHMSETDRRLSYNQHDKYMYVSCHSWITCQEPIEDCLLVNMISTCMYRAIHGSHVSGTDRRLSYSQHDKYRYVSYHSWITCQEQTIFCRFLTCDPWMAWYIPVLIMLIIGQSSVGSWDMWSMNGMIHTCTYHVD
jgi:hypothetical protein